MSKAEELRSLDNDTLLERLEDAKEELFNLRFSRASGQLEDTSRVKFVKREVARLRTILHERKLAQQVVQEEKK